jgi:hypothetical protein
MADSPNNLLLRLHKWARRQDENFLTESFAHLLQYLLATDGAAGLYLVNELTKGKLDLRLEELHVMEVFTQNRSAADAAIAEGVTDIEIRVRPTKLAIVEVKSRSLPTDLQIDKYIGHLNATGAQKWVLVLLTRHRVPDQIGVGRPVERVRWFDVADWLSCVRENYELQPECKFLLDQFLGFLRARNMTIEKVSWELTSGVRAVGALSNMLLEIARASKRRPRLRIDPECFGLYLGGASDWVGMRYAQPNVLEFSTLDRAIDKEKAEMLGIDGIFNWTNSKWWGWRRYFDLTDEREHFFAVSKAKQIELLNCFLNECFATADAIWLSGVNAQTAEREDPDASLLLKETP